MKHNNAGPPAWSRAAPDLMLTPGTVAPDFALPNQHRQTVRLSDFRDKQLVVLAFHPLAFTPVCSVQMQTYERERPRLDAAHARVFGISLDAGPSKKAWGDALGGISFDLLSDFHPHGEVARAYQVLRDDGLVERAIYVVGLDGTIKWVRKYEIPEQPGFEELMEVLKG